MSGERRCGGVARPSAPSDLVNSVSSPNVERKERLRALQGSGIRP